MLCSVYVQVGRWMRDSLPHPHYFEFAYSREPTWHSEHMASAMLDMFRSHARVPAARRGGSGAESVLPPAFQGVVRATLAGGLIAYLETKASEWKCKTLSERLLTPPSVLFKDQIGN